MKKIISKLLVIVIASLSIFYLSSCENNDQELKKYREEKIELISNKEYTFNSPTSYINLTNLAETYINKIETAKSKDSIDELLNEYDKGINDIEDNDPLEVEKDYQKYLEKLAKDGSDYDPLMPTLNEEIIKGEYTGYLGRGYNVVKGAYFNGNDVNSLYILNMDKCIEDKMVRRNNASRVLSKQFFGSSFESYQRHISDEMNISFSYGLFSKTSAEFNLSSSSDIETITNSYFIKNQFQIQRAKESIGIDYTDVNVCQAYANEQFLKRINASLIGLDEEQIYQHYANIFDVYGTHVLTNILLGGRFDLNYVYHGSETTTTNDVQIGVEAAYTSVTTKTSGSLDVNMEEKAKSFIENSTFSVSTIGGTTALNVISYENAVKAYDVWIESIENQQSLELYDVNATPIPIWEFADEGRQLLISQLFTRYAEENGGLFSDIGDKLTYGDKLYIKQLYIGHGASKIEAMHDIDRQIAKDAKNGLKYETAVTVNTDLKAGAGEDYVLIGYVTTYDKTEAINDIMVSIDLNKDGVVPPKGYHKIDYDLNNAYDYLRDITFGKYNLHFYTIPYVYIYYSKESSYDPICSIGVEENHIYRFGKATKGWSACESIPGLKTIDLNYFLTTGNKPAEIKLWVYRKPIIK